LLRERLLEPAAGTQPGSVSESLELSRSATHAVDSEAPALPDERAAEILKTSHKP